MYNIQDHTIHRLVKSPNKNHYYKLFLHRSLRYRISKLTFLLVYFIIVIVMLSVRNVIVDVTIEIVSQYSISIRYCYVKYI